MSSSTTSASLYLATVSLPSTAGGTPETAAEKAHHLKNGKGFANPWKSWREQSPWDIISFLVWRRLTGEANSPDTTPPTVPVRKPEFLPSRHSPHSTPIRATWLGHACYFVEFSTGLRILFDPVFSHRCSPFQWLGPKRYTEAPCEIEDVPIVDAVCISHSHYDHMDHPTIMRIVKRHPKAHFFVPLRNKEWFVKCGISSDQVTELDWWEERELKITLSSSDNNNESAKVEKPTSSPTTSESSSSPSSDTITATISALPCQHIGARTPFDRGHTLWSSWSVTSGSKSVYFGGDTGYRSVPKLSASVDDYGSDHDYPHCPAFAEIGKHRGPFDLALIPIGAYNPRWIMSPMHANPFDSVNIFTDIKAKRAMGIHWGTWVLTEEDVLEPPKMLKEALKRKGIEEEGVFDVCDIGESREFE